MDTVFYSSRMVLLYMLANVCRKEAAMALHQPIDLRIHQYCSAANPASLNGTLLLPESNQNFRRTPHCPTLPYSKLLICASHKPILQNSIRESRSRYPRGCILVISRRFRKLSRIEDLVRLVGDCIWIQTCAPKAFTQLPHEVKPGLQRIKHIDGF
jgi:hypothetical protein